MSILYGAPDKGLIISLKHRISFAYVEYARVHREDNSIVARNINEEVDLPVANLTALLLGTGASITQEAMGELSRWGCNVTFTMGGGDDSDILVRKERTGNDDRD